MKKNLIAIIILVGLLAVSGLAVIKAQTTPTANQTISAEQVNAVGFTNAVKLQPQNGKYDPLVNYFKVKETVTGQAAKDWGDASNLLAILIEPTPWWQGFGFNSGQMQTTDINGRTQAKLTTSGYYLVVTGPDKNKVGKLANRLAEMFK